VRRPIAGSVPCVTHEFLSPEWIDAAREIRSEYADRVPSPPISVRVNVVVTEAPFGEGTVLGFIDSAAGQVEIESGALEALDLTIRLDWGTARAVFVDQDASAFMKAFMEGRIRPEGDVAKLLALQPLLSGPTDPAQQQLAGEVAAKIRAITA
jgi:hypothetical protein